jgi:hypothetical protein
MKIKIAEVVYTPAQGLNEIAKIEDVIAHIMPDHMHWTNQGATITVTDDYYPGMYRHVTVWAESADEKVLNLMLIKGCNK